MGRWSGIKECFRAASELKARIIRRFGAPARPTLKGSVWQLGAHRLFVTSVEFYLDPGDR